MCRLNDGIRRGRPGGDITFEDDWRALGSTLVDLYNLVEPELIPEGKSRIDVARRQNQLISMNRTFFEIEGRQCSCGSYGGDIYGRRRRVFYPSG